MKTAIYALLTAAIVPCLTTFIEASASGGDPFSKKSMAHAAVATLLVFCALLKQSPLTPKVDVTK